MPTQCPQCSRVDQRGGRFCSQCGFDLTTVASRHGPTALPRVRPGARPLERTESKPKSKDLSKVETRIIEIVSEQLSVDKLDIDRQTSFVDDLNADSLDTVELVMELEEAFEMSIPDEEAAKVGTVGALIDYIERSQNDRQG